MQRPQGRLNVIFNDEILKAFHTHLVDVIGNVLNIFYFPRRRTVRAFHTVVKRRPRLMCGQVVRTNIYRDRIKLRRDVLFEKQKLRLNILKPSTFTHGFFLVKLLTVGTRFTISA